MNFTMTKPCAHCPFRVDIPGYLRGERMEEIIDALFNDQSFTCHETTVPDEDDESGEMVDGRNAQHCAGAMIFLEHQERANQMMRISERLGLYDRRALDMDAPVPDCEFELIEHHELAEGRQWT